VSASDVKGSTTQLERASSRYWWFIVAIILAVGLVLRVQHVHDPVMDHPNWRQGDTASIARNFATLNGNILYPQTDYNGPPPNYVELELQILPFLAALLYKIFGIHPIFGRLIAIVFSLGTTALLAFFARSLYASAFAGLAAAAFFALFPGSVYYGRTFTPDVVMVFFVAAALYAATELLLGPSTSRSAHSAALAQGDTVSPEPLNFWSVLGVTLLFALAYLAKPVSVLAIVPLAGMLWENVRRRGAPRAREMTAFAALLIVPLIILWFYDRAMNAHAEWHWASAITEKHVIPALIASFSGVRSFFHKAHLFIDALGLLRITMLGNIAFALTIAACIAIHWTRPRSKLLLWGWLVGGSAYAFIVVTVEHVDYYLFPFLPFAALVLAGAMAWIARTSRSWTVPTAVATSVALAILVQGRVAVAKYYHYDRTAYRNAALLAHVLPPRALIVMGHYGPDVLYYIDRFGWEEDPELWTPFDEESAINKGARYFISVEDNRLRANADLCAYLQRFPMKRIGTWPVYETDPTLVSRNAEPFWDAFRRADRAGGGRAFLDAHHVCLRKHPQAQTVGTLHKPSE
jgi:hypothetical protein